MAITYEWGIEKLNVLQSPKTDFVTEIIWFCKATDSDTYKVEEPDGDDENGNAKYKEVDVPYTAKRSRIITKLKESSSFTPFADLTESQVIGWVKDILGDEVAVVEQATANMINSQKNPLNYPTAKDLPW